MTTAEFLQGELERLFELESMLALSSDLLGLEPTDLGGTGAKGTFARALVRHCASNEGLPALADAIRLSAKRPEQPLAEPVVSVEDRELASGTQVGGFRILKRVAEGPLASVYLAERPAPNNGHTERAAIKVFRSDHTRDRGAAWRLLTTARALKNVQDTGLANIYEAGTLPDGRVFVASEYIPGQTLAGRIGRTGAIHFNEMRSVVRTLLRALGTLHQRGLLHGHLKAENVFLVRPQNAEGERAQPYGVLSDLATSRLLESQDQRNGVLRLVGEPSTLAPEVARGQKPDARSEIYAMGCLVYQALTGKPVFEASTAIDQIAAHLYEEPLPPSERAPRNWVPAELDEAILRALSKEPAERYDSARDFADALENVALSIFPPAPTAGLDMEQLLGAIASFQEDPSDQARAAQIEALVAPSKSWQHVIDTFLENADAVDDGEVKKHLLFRSARILADEMKDAEAAERVYRVVLEYDPSDAQAHNAIEELHRQSGDHEGLTGLLLDRLDNETDPDARGSILREVATLYEEELEQPDNAFVAFIQALAENPDDDRSVRAVERLAKTQEQWAEAASSLHETIESTDRPRHALSLCVILADWYTKRMGRPDVALPYLNRALQIDPAHEPALEAMTALYREAQSWSELSHMLLHRADAASSPARARDFKAEAAAVVHGKLGDVAQAERMFAEVFADDPTHPSAIKALGEIYAAEGAWKKLSGLLEQKSKEQRGTPRVETLCELGELYEDRLDNLDAATQSYNAALSHDDKNLVALKGLERLHARRGEYTELLANLERQLSVATTPAQRTSLLDRIGAILEEHMGDAAKAAERYEQIIELAPGHDAANTALARLYRELHRFDDLAQTLDRHAKGAENAGRKVDLLMQAARVLMADVGSPERAAFVCERVLAIAPEHPDALAITARIRALAGDSVAALDALELLADTEQDASKKADLWVRAGTMLEEHDDLDGAIDRYKLALDANAGHEPALVALGRLYERRGDTRGEAELLLRKVELAQDPIVRAQRLVALGTLRLEKLKDKSLAADAFQRARELHPENLEALLGLGRLALERRNWEEAAEFLGPLLEHTTELANDVARQVCLGAGDAYRALGQLPKAERAYLNAKAFAPHDRTVIERLSDVAVENGNHEEASTLLGDLLDRFGTSLNALERGGLLLKLGAAHKQLGELGKAAVAFTSASELLIESPEPLDALCEVQEAQGNFEAMARTLRRRIDLADGDQQRFKLWVRAGDLFAFQLKDRDKASKAYVAALELNADDRNLLSKLMAVYSEAKDWSRLVEVLVRMADVVEEPKLRGKYLHTAGAITQGELGAFVQAIDYYEKALAYDPSLDAAFRGLADCLSRGANWERLAGAYRAYIERSREHLNEEQLASLWDNLGELYHQRLNRVDEAIAAHEAAHEIDPENRARIERLVDIYGKHASRYADRAIAAHAELLTHNTYRIESYKALRKLYTQLQRPDEAWAVCQALRGLNMAEPDEEAFFKRHRIQAPATARECITEEIWQEYILHGDQDALLTNIFAIMQPAAIQDLAQKPESFGITRSGVIDCQNDQSVMAQMLFYASGVSLIPLPPVFYRPNDAGGVTFMFTSPPSLGLGQGAFQGAPDQALAFIGGRQLSYFRPGHYMRQLVPTGSGLRSWLLAAIRLANPRFPVPDAMRAQVEKNHSALSRTLHPPQQQSLTSLVEQLLREQPELDMKRWALGVDLSADRIGFVLANSLDAAVAVVRASPADSSYASERDRLKELYQYAVSPRYLALRQAIGVTIA